MIEQIRRYNMPLWDRAIDIIVMVVLALLPLYWLPGDYTVLGHDSGYPLDPVRYLTTRLSTWRQDDVFGGDMSYSMGAIPLHAIEAGFVKLGLSVPSAQKANLIVWFIAIEVSMYLFATYLNRHVNHRNFPIIATVLYAVNYYTLEFWKLGAGTTFSAYTAFPLVLLTLFMLTEGVLTPVLSGIVAAVTLSVFNAGGGFGLPLFGGLAIAFIVYAIYQITIVDAQARRRETKRFVLWMVSLFSVYVVLNAYWLLPFIWYASHNFDLNIASGGGIAGVKSWTDSVSQTTSISNLLRLQGIPDWYNNIKHPFSNTVLNNVVFIIVSFLFAPLAYGSVLLLKNVWQKRMIGYFFFLSLVGLFFTAGTHAPTGYLYGLLMDYVPGFVIFRSPQFKFVPMIYLAFSVLIAYTICTLSIMMSRKWVKLAYWIIIAVIYFGYHFPFFTSIFFDWNLPLTLRVIVPKYIYKLTSILDSTVSDTRLLLLPSLNSLWKVEAYRWGLWTPQNLVTLLTGHGTLENQQTVPQAARELLNRFYDELRSGNPLALRFVSFFRSPTVLLRNDMYTDLDWTPTENSNVYSDTLPRLGFQLIVQKGAWNIYSLINWQDPGLLRLETSLTSFSGPSEAIPGVVIAQQNAFVWNESMKVVPALKTIFSSLPIIQHIEAVSCGSCLLAQPAEAIPSGFVRLLPGSRFYFLKQWKERQLLTTTDSKQRMINLLGLTSVRLTELIALRTNQAPGYLVDQTASLFRDYWESIRESMQSDPTILHDYALLRLMTSYLEKEKNSIESILPDITGITHDQLLGSLHNILDISMQIGTIRSESINGILTYRIIGRQGLIRFYLDAGQLPYDRSGAAIAPHTLRIGSTDVPLKTIVNGPMVELTEASIPKDSDLSLMFPHAESLLGPLVREQNTFTDPEETCLTGKVEAFRRRDLYRAHVEFGDEVPVSAKVYVRLERSTVNTSTGKTFANPYPVSTYILADQGKKKQTDVVFQGSDSDTGALVSFCTSNGNPGKYLSSIEVARIISPYLYIQTEPLLEAHTEPVVFTKIDPTTYRFTISDVRSRVLIFDQRFHPGWRIRPISLDSTRDSSLPWIDRTVFNNQHFPVNGYLNGWYLPEHAQGVYELYFYPQQLFSRGVLISAVGLGVLMFAWAVYFFIRRMKGRI